MLRGHIEKKSLPIVKINIRNLEFKLLVSFDDKKDI